MPLAATSLDRAAQRRSDPDWIERAFASNDVLVLLMRGGEPMLSPPSGPRAPRRLAWLGPEASDLNDTAGRLFLGEDKAGSPVFAVDLNPEFDPTGSVADGYGDFEEMRAAAAMLPGFDANAAATARALFDWHRRHGFCANCGAASTSVEAGWKRECPNCGAEHFPRTDPVAIMLAVQGDQCLLGRESNWPAGFYSCLAGFVEPGETIEQAAARELFEEAGIRADAKSAEYLFSQPWPFPSSLMLGLILNAETTDIRVDETEIEAAQWFSRDDVRAILSGAHPEVYAPPPMAVAHHIMKVWCERA